MKVYRADIDGLRAIAVMSVILYHLDFSIFQGGFFGVDVFFVISGFLITSQIKESLLADRFNFFNYFARRVRRLLPAFLFMAILSCILAILLFSPDDLKEFGASLLHSTLSLSNVFFWQKTGYFDGAANLKPLLHTWSLSVEEQFFFIWPFFMFLIFQIKNKYFPLVAISLITVASFFLGHYWSQFDRATSFFLTQFRIFEFGIGAIISWTLPLQPKSKFVSEIFYTAGAGLICIAVFGLNAQLPLPSSFSLIPCLGTALILQFHSSKYIKSILEFKPVVLVGLMSYSLYLIHWPSLVFSKYIGRGTTENSVKLAILITTLVLGWISYRWIEVRFRKKPLGQNQLSPWVFGTLSSSLVLVLLVVGGSMWQSGWTWRITASPELLKLYESKESDDLLYGGNGCVPPLCETHPEAPEREAILVMGDSHARAYFSGFKASRPETKFIFITAEGCDFSSTNYTHSFKEKGPNSEMGLKCQEARKMAFETIKRGVRAVILSQNFGYFNLISTRDGRELTFSKEDQDFHNYYVREITSFKSEFKIKNFAVIANVPSSGNLSSVLNCLMRPFVGHAECEETLMGDIYSRYMINVAFSEKLPADILVFDPFKVFCTDTSCKNILDGLPLYFDKAHLTVFGSKTLAHIFFKDFSVFFKE